MLLPLRREEIYSNWDRWRAEMARRMGACQLAREDSEDPGDSPVRVDERLIQAIWHDQMIERSRLATASGKALEILEPGRWNTARGPDFLDARLRLAGQEIKGDIEIHVDSADWRRHQHDHDFYYNNVVLHVSLRASDDRPHDEKQNGKRLERLILEHTLEPDLETIRSSINLSDYPYGRPDDIGICHEQFLALPPEELRKLFTDAGRARIESKIERFEAQRGASSFLQTLYQAILTSQGFKSSKTLYFLLSKRAPVSELQEFARDVSKDDHDLFYFSVLSHVARLIPEQKDLLDEADEETKELLEKLERLWRPVRPYLADRLIPPTKRWYSGVRPAGFPTRRLTAAATLARRITSRENNAFQQFLSDLRGANLNEMSAREHAKFWKALCARFTVENTEQYFSKRFTFGGKQSRPQSLLGEPAARSLVFNVLLPMAILYAREKEDVALECRAWEAALQFPALEKNSVVKFMDRRIFGDQVDWVGKGFLKVEVNQQALLKIFSDCCAQNEKSCRDCTLLAMNEKNLSVSVTDQ